MRVTRLSVTPVKGLALHHPLQVEVRTTGVVGDRQFYVVDERDGLFSIAKTGALLGLSAEYDVVNDHLTFLQDSAPVADGPVVLGAAHVADFFAFKKVRGRLVVGPWSELLSARAGRPLRLVKADEPDGAHDVEPLTFLGDASTRVLSQAAGLPDVDARRFRMLVEFDGAAAHAEDEWRDRLVQVGDVVARMGGPVQRCAGTTRNPVTGDVDLKTLKIIGDYRGRQDSIFGMGFNFGVYATVVTEGTIRVGDGIDLLPQ